MSAVLDVIVGTWKLLSYDMTVTSESGESEVRKIAGESPLGRIMFTQDQFMSAHVTDPMAIRPTEGNAWFKASDEEVLRSARPHVSYCGQFELLRKGEDYFLSTNVHVSLDPNWAGSQQVRRVELKEENGCHLLTLHPVQEIVLSDGKKAKASLTWGRLH